MKYSRYFEVTNDYSKQYSEMQTKRRTAKLVEPTSLASIVLFVLNNTEIDYGSVAIANATMIKHPWVLTLLL